MPQKFLGLATSLSDDNEYYDSHNGVLYSEGYKELIYYSPLLMNESYTVHENTMVIRTNSIVNNIYLDNLILKENVLVLGNGAFTGTLLKTIEFKS